MSERRLIVSSSSKIRRQGSLTPNMFLRYEITVYPTLSTSSCTLLSPRISTSDAIYAGTSDSASIAVSVFTFLVSSPFSLSSSPQRPRLSSSLPTLLFPHPFPSPIPCYGKANRLRQIAILSSPSFASRMTWRYCSCASG